MPDNPKALQGSLFGDIETDSQDSRNGEKELSEATQEFSDEELTRDAKLRPRKRTLSKTAINQPSSIDDQVIPNRTNTDLPAWSDHKLVNKELLTPMLRHYVEQKEANQERILLYRLGDFFECFFEDAIKLSEVLELTLTGKEGGKQIGRVPMAGIPHHAAERYCAELIRQGMSVAICDQLENIANKGSLIKRGITRILTPGTVIEEGMLQARRNNWLAAIIFEKNHEKNTFAWGLANADVSTGEFLVMQGKNIESLSQQLQKIEASEVISCESDDNPSNGWCPTHIKITPIPKTPFNKTEAEAALKSHYQLSTVNGLGLNEWPLALRAAGGLLKYLQNTNPKNVREENIQEEIKISMDPPKLIFEGDFLILDSQTRRNLEITSTQKDGQFHGSLLWAIDRTHTAMGGRCLRRWLEEPLLNYSEINARQEIVTVLVKDRPLRQSIRKLLRTMGDLERLAGRAGAGQAGARDLVAIADGLERLPKLAAKVDNFDTLGPKWLKNLKCAYEELKDLSNEIRHQLVNSPPLSLTEGGLIHDGVDDLLDGIRNQLDDQSKWLKNQEIQERKISGITNLKLQYHRTFGYFLAVSRAKSEQVPDHWIRRQTLANEERFITPDLKSNEGKIFQSKARGAQREYELFCRLREKVGSQAYYIRKAARAVAGLDALSGLAEIASTNSYCRPQILDSKEVKNKILLKDSRHPVVEQMLVEKKFQPNDLYIGEENDLIILTGPNASGKSCYLRQIGLVQLLAQIGGWVPAKSASLSIADRIFTRVGAVDDLAAGQSTFIVEMSETACILNHATKKSLVLLDEIGRGTATYDGLSIAWAVSEYLAKNIQSRTIFATHYHELNLLANQIDNVINFQVLVKETGEELFFLHQVAPGGANRSYGLEAARLAGVPKDVIKRATQILNKLETKQSTNQNEILPKNIDIPSAA